MTIHPARIHHLNRTRIQKPAPNKDFVLYWMQQSQRAVFNHALEFAVDQANDLGLPLVAGFGLTDAYPDANLRHYTFMLEGLSETRIALADRDIQLVVVKGSPPDVALNLGRQAALIVCDAGYLRHQRQWRDHVARTPAARSSWWKPMWWCQWQRPPPRRNTQPGPSAPGSTRCWRIF